MMSKLIYKFLVIVFLIVFQGLMFAQSVPNQSAPVNGSYWDSTTPTLYWWYTPNPYVYATFTYSVQVSKSASDFSSANLVVNASVSGQSTASYNVLPAAGLIVGVTYYWRVGIGGNYSTVWSFTPNNGYYGGGGGPVPLNYTISASNGANGTISPSGSITVAENANQVFTITANTGYQILDVVVDGSSVGNLATYTFTNVTADHTISATFELEPQITYVAISGGDDLNGDGSQAHPYRTIQRGINQTDDNGTVYVYNGNYVEDVNIQRPVTILGESNPSTSSFVIWESDVVIKNFEVYGVTGSGPGPGIQKRGFQSWEYMENLTLENIEVHNCDEQGLLLENIGKVTIKNSRFYDNQMAGVAIAACNNVTLEDVGTENNLRGLWAHLTSNLTLTRVYVEDNGKFYSGNYPDQNGFTLTECTTVTINTLYSNNNDEQGFKLEDCNFIDFKDVSASNNTTDGMAFINCTEVNFDGGFSNNNGNATGDNGLELVKCTNFELKDFAANGNKDGGIYLGTRYSGQYQYDISNPANSLRANEFIGLNNELKFTNVSAGGNILGDGLSIVHTTYGEFNNLEMSNNGINGLLIDASHHLTFMGGTFNNNTEAGIKLFPKTHNHKASHNVSNDDITYVAFNGDFNIKENGEQGIFMNTSPALAAAPPYIAIPETKIDKPIFNGKFYLYNNNGSQLELNGKIFAPSFYGMVFEISSSSSFPAVMLDDGVASPPMLENVTINNSIFNGYIPGSTTIDNSTASDVDAKYNIFGGASTLNDVKTSINDKEDLGSLGLVDVTGWTNGKSTIKFGSESAYTGSMVTIPVTLNQPIAPETFNELEGLISYNDVNLLFKYATTGTGTLVHDAGWSVIWDHSVANELKFWAIGFTPISTSGKLFYLTFEVLDVNDGSETISALASDIYADNVASKFDIVNGTINYTSDTNISLLRGDATLDHAVDLGDYIAVVNHINGILLSGQGLLNGDVNNDGIVNALDASEILSFIDNGIWPNTSTGGNASLLFASSTVNQNGLLRFPITIGTGQGVRSLEVELDYNEAQVDFKSYVQLLKGGNYRVDASKISDGKAKLVFSSAKENENYFVPAEVLFNLKSNPNSNAVIGSKYSVNGGEFKQGPTFTADGITDVKNETIPNEFKVSQNYPNPFNPSTTIMYSIPKRGLVTIKIYDILGGLVKTLVNREVESGTYQTNWNSVDNFGRKVSSGVYFYRVENGANIVTKKMVLIK